MIEIKTLIMVVSFLITIGGLVGAFFTMQTKQNMKIEQLSEKVKALENKEETHLETEKLLGILVVKMDRLIKDMEELKVRGCGQCG